MNQFNLRDFKSKSYLQNESKKNKKSKTLKNKKTKKTKNINKICNEYGIDLNGTKNDKLYTSCKINKFCRKYKCKNIDKKFKKHTLKKIGNQYNNLLLTSIYNNCNYPTMVDKKLMSKYNKCKAKKTLEFYKNNNLDHHYKKILECDTLCAKEKKIFLTNLFRFKNKRIKKEPQLNINNLPDIEYIKSN